MISKNSCQIPTGMLDQVHVSMLNGSVRNNFYLKALQKTAKGKIVLDVGTGTGLLAAYALKSGAEFVYAVENDPKAAKMAQNTLSTLFPQNKFKVIVADFWTSEIDTEIPHGCVDILISDTVGNALFNGGMISTWHCAKPFLKADAISIPDRLHMDAHVYHDINLPGATNPIGHLTPIVFSTLHESNLLYTDFYNALKKYLDEEQYCHDWIDLKQVDQEPDIILKDICTATKDQSAPILFSDKSYPLHMQAQIEFELEVKHPSSVVLINHVSFGDTTITLTKTGWQVAPCANFAHGPYAKLQIPGRYQFKHNPDLFGSVNNCWFIKPVA